MLHSVLLIIHFFCAISIVALVLLQRGKGAEAGAGFGAGASGTVFGARGASTALSRATAILAAVFMLTSLSLAYVGTRKSAPSSSLLDQLAHQNEASQVVPAAPPAAPPAGMPSTGAAPEATAPATAPPATAPATGTPPK